MTENIDESVLNKWKKTRSGAWAGRGFHYQHLFSTLILVRQWAGLAPAGYLVPEGLEDCVIELSDREVWLQIKSRKSGTFSDAEVKAVIAEIKGKAALVKNKKKTQFAVGLEQPCSGIKEHGVDQLFENHAESTLICRAPEEEIIALLTERLDTAEIIAEGIANDLYKLVAESSATNASLPFEKRRRISTTEIDRRIFERLEAEDPSAIDLAFVSRALEPVDFVTPVSEPGFYQGVKAKPGHVAAGLVLSRRDETNSIVTSLKSRRHVLIAGPSGAGKSALMWLAASALAAEFRWFQVTAKAGARDADAIVRFVRARRPKTSSPIGLAFDEIGASNSDLWNILVRELRVLPDVYFLGSVRREDVNLIANQSDTEFVEASLDEKLAQSVWEQLTNQNQTNWSHWREPFEQSEGLMLEYVHVLTQGERLAALIREQVRQRQKEERHDELAIIRSTSVLCARGGEVEAQSLFALLELSPNDASQALKRLIDEHLVRESRPGVLGGLHTLRSKALSDASHDDVVYLRTDSLWRGLQAATGETLPRIIQSVLAETQEETEQATLKKVAETLAQSDDANVWAAILTGLGLGTLERYVASFMATLEQHGVQRAQWSLASMFADVGIDIPDLPELEQWQSFRDAILAFRTLPKRDLRAACLELLPEESQVPACTDLRQANRFLSCLVPIAGGEPIRMTFVPDFTSHGGQDIRDVAALLSTAYLIGPDVAENLAAAFGGEQTLFSWFSSQTPWVATPIVEPDGSHGRTARANWFLVAEDYQPDPHETVCNICETLIALSPVSDAAASDAVDPSGQPITVGEFSPWSKNIPRKNLPANARVAWNVAFRQILLARAAADSLTDYTAHMTALVRRTEKLFRSFSEKWIKGKSISNTDELAAEINEIIEQVNALAYATQETPAALMTSPAKGAGVDDTLGTLLTGVLGNLVPRMSQITAAAGNKAVATFSGSLAAQTQEQEGSDIWRTTSSPPLKELAALAERLNDVACILHEMAHDDGQAAIQGIVKAARKGTLGKAVRAAARRCRTLADRRFRERLRVLENALKEQGWSAQCWSRPIDESDSVYWPAREIAILVEIADFESDARYIEDGLAIGQQQLGNDWPFRIVPVIGGQVLASLALLPSSHMPLPDQDFAQEWQGHIDRPFLSSETAERFDAAIAACAQMSAIVTCRDLENLHPEEDEVFSKAIESFERNRGLVAAAAERTGSEHCASALDYLDQNWNQVVSEFEAAKAGQPVNEPLCMNAHLALAGQENEQAAELAAARVLLLQAECSGADGSSVNPAVGTL